MMVKCFLFLLFSLCNWDISGKHGPAGEGHTTPIKKFEKKEGQFKKKKKYRILYVHVIKNCFNHASATISLLLLVMLLMTMVDFLCLRIASVEGQEKV